MMRAPGSIRVSMVLAAVAAAIAYAIAPSAAGALAPQCGWDSHHVWHCDDESPGSGTPGGGGPPGGGGHGPTQPTMYTWWWYDAKQVPGALAEDGTVINECWALVVIKVSPDPPPPENTKEGAQAELDSISNNGVTLAACPVEPAQPIESPADIAARSWGTDVRPPPPDPVKVYPRPDSPRNLVSFKTFVTIAGATTMDQTVDNRVGEDIRITASVKYVIDWGDNSSSVSTTNGALPPGGDGEIAHKYATTGSPTITVTAKWTGHWQAGPFGGPLGEIDLNSQPHTIRIFQAQAQTN
jgi:hypothetical protein